MSHNSEFIIKCNDIEEVFEALQTETEYTGCFIFNDGREVILPNYKWYEYKDDLKKIAKQLKITICCERIGEEIGDYELCVFATTRWSSVNGEVTYPEPKWESY